MIGLIASDLDGTLLRDDTTVSDRTRSALAAARECGIAVVLVSARPPRTVMTIAASAGVGGFAVCCNGAIVYDLDRREIVDNVPFPAAAALSLVTSLRVALPGVSFAMEQGLDLQCEAEFAGLHPERETEMPTIVDALARFTGADALPVTKLIVRHPGYSAVELLTVVRDHAGERADVTHSGAPFVEVSAAGIHKAAGLARLCANLGIAAADVLAFGDMPNDLPMLAWAGHGVAVANADPEVLAVANEITASNMDDGVAMVVERVVGSKTALPIPTAQPPVSRVGGSRRRPGSWWRCRRRVGSGSGDRR